MTESAASVFALIQRPSPGGWRAHDVPIEVVGKPVRLARNGDGRPCLLVPAPGHAAGTLLVTRGLKAHVQAVADGAAYEDWLIVTSLDAHLDSTFFRLCDSVLRQLAALGEADGVDATISVVERWRELLESVASPVLSEGPCAGLLAELHALEHLTTRIGVQAAMKSWVGHDRSRVDFRFASAGVEVKATLHRDRFLVTIHGLLQMDTHGVGKLFLFAQQLERVPSG
ncbi:PD-(D/E)XK motif protein, partial [Phycicoccus sp. Soil748]|uniref:PD-(D/E)XK motif protein n=1 Tax=Phycicoccus sp. Soil748 TaxID=1736397 RepID=UPI0035142846